MTDSDATIAALQARIMELEIRSEERKHDVERLQTFVEGYERRVSLLEKSLADLRSLAENPAEAMPKPGEDLPPHY
jgi:uncharacterized coiled-coil protein SlyX